MCSNVDGTRLHLFGSDLPIGRRASEQAECRDEEGERSSRAHGSARRFALGRARPDQNVAVTIALKQVGAQRLDERRIVDLDRDSIEVRRIPVSGAYTEAATVRRVEMLQSSMLPELQFDAAAILG